MVFNSVHHNVSLFCIITLFPQQQQQEELVTYSLKPSCMNTNNKRNKMLCLSTLGKTLINTKKLQTPTEVVHKTRSLLLYSKNYPNAASQVSSNASFFLCFCCFHSKYMLSFCSLIKWSWSKSHRGVLLYVWKVVHIICKPHKLYFVFI